MGVILASGRGNVRCRAWRFPWCVARERAVARISRAVKIARMVAFWAASVTGFGGGVILVKGRIWEVRVAVWRAWACWFDAGVERSGMLVVSV